MSRLLNKISLKLDDVREISVPSSYNEIYTNKTIKDHIGFRNYFLKKFFFTI